jgi:hypothetical protein
VPPEGQEEEVAMTISTPQNVIRERQRNIADGFAGLDADGRLAAPIKMGSLAELGVLDAGVLAIETSGGSLKNATAISLRVGDGATSGGLEVSKFGGSLLLE